MHLVGDLFELYDDARTCKLYICNSSSNHTENNRQVCSGQNDNSGIFSCFFFLSQVQNRNL